MVRIPAVTSLPSLALVVRRGLWVGVTWDERTFEGLIGMGRRRDGPMEVV
jgi:hypothetical protein